MDTLAPVSSIMTTNLLTVSPDSKLSEVKRIFDENKIHHLPVVNFKNISGIISKVDVLNFLKGANVGDGSEAAALEQGTAKDIMTKGMAKLAPNERISVAVNIFKENLFHAIPIVENDELVGIVTTYDIIKNIK